MTHFRYELVRAFTSLSQLSADVFFTILWLTQLNPNSTPDLSQLNPDSTPDLSKLNPICHNLTRLFSQVILSH